MKYFTYLACIFLGLLKFNVFAQEYTPPLDINMLLSGTFGELRGNHFHCGIDIKTNGVVGKNVYSIDVGYISRIKVSTFGYGKAIYINHPNGTTSVYAHLKEFSAKIDSVIKKEHYKKEKFEINYYPDKDELIIKKGEIIALSGNSGSSGGPHLHFEIRNTKTERPINPLLLGLNITDEIPPLLKSMKLYSISQSTINGKEKDKIFDLRKDGNNYSITEDVTINGAFAVGISAYDKINNCNNKNGVYKIELYVDSIIYYEFQADKLDFKTNRYINAHIDYEEYKKRQVKYHRCFKLSNNKLNNYKTIKNNGIIKFNDAQSHIIEVKVSDFYGNTSNLKFNIQNERGKNIIKRNEEKTNLTKIFSYHQPNIFKKENIEIHMDKYSLYEQLEFEYKLLDSIKGVFGNIHQCHYDFIPIHKKYVISIKANVPESLKNKVYIAKRNKNNNFSYMGGDWQNGFLRTKVREFGDFCIVADTINPSVKGINIYPGKSITNQNTIKCTIKDQDSGIQSYRGEIDGKWILMEYDYKSNLLIFDIDTNLKKGQHTLQITVIDNVDNITRYRSEFTY